MAEPLVTLPPHFVATKYPGYFWNVQSQTLWSIKIDGVLKEMKVTKPTVWNEYRSGYRISHLGRRRWLDHSYLKDLQPRASVIPVEYRIPPQAALPF